MLLVVWFSTDWFLNEEFSSYGHDFVQHINRVVRNGPEDPMNPMNEVFPKVSKCTFFKFGLSGTQEKLDGLCVLSLNNLNEKGYIFLWFWYIFLGINSAWIVIWRTILMCIPTTKRYVYVS